MKDSHILTNGDSGPHNGVEPETVDVIVCLPDRGNLKNTFTFDVHDKVWAAKQIVINEMCKGLRDVLNYGFYDPPYNGRSGKFLEEERPFKDYPLRGPYVEFKYKRRVYRSLSFDEKVLQKLHTKGNLRRMMDCVASNAVNQVVRLTEKGLDPNFQDDRTGESPLTAAAVGDNRSEMIIALVNGGAHLDFRARDSQTALHKAAITGKVFSVKTLLDLGASPNYKDAKGLTPLYYSTLHSSDPYCSEILLNDHAELQIVDHQGMQEIHHACKNGLVQHLEHLLFYGANIDARTASGNTGLHITALSNHEECARVLLFRGARRDILNYANQSAYEVAAVAGNKSLAELIKYFDDESVVQVNTKPSYSTRRRKTVSKPSASSVFRQSSTEQQLSAKSMDSLTTSTNSSLNSLQSNNSDPVANGENGTVSEEKLKRTLSMSSSASDSSYCSEDDSNELSPPERRSSRTAATRQESVSSGQMEQGAPPVKSVSGAATIRKRVYATEAGKKFKAISDYCTEMPGELTLQRGDIVEVLYVGEKGFWEGRVGDRTGWFPHRYVKEYKEKGKQRPKTLFGRPPAFPQVFTKSDPQINLSGEGAPEAPRVVKLQRTKAGFGFQLRGANSHVPRLNFKPTPEFPALQYFGEVEKGGEADTKGIRIGDFILEVNGKNVTTATHNHVVELIKKSGASVTLKVVAVPQSPATNGTLARGDWKLFPDKYGSMSRLSTKPPPIPPSRHPSTTLTLGRMRPLSRPSLYELGMQHSVEEPSIYKVDSVITVSKENRWHTLQKQRPSTGMKPSIKKDPSSRRSSGSTPGSSVSSKGYQRSISLQNIRQGPPSYETAVSVSKAVPFPTVPVGATLPQSNADGASAMPRLGQGTKSTPDILASSSEPDNTSSTGPQTMPKPAKERPVSCAVPEYHQLNQLREEKAEFREKSGGTGSSPDVTVIDNVPRISRSISQPAVSCAITYDQPAVTRTNSTPGEEKESLGSKNVSLSDALQLAIAARNTRKSKQVTDSQEQGTERGRKISAPAKMTSSETVRVDMTPLQEDFRERDNLKGSHTSSVETVKPQPKMSPIHEKISEYEEWQVQSRKLSEPCRLPSGVQSVQSKIEKLEKQPVSDESMGTATSETIYRQYTSPSPRLDKQFIFDNPPSSPTKRLSRHFSANDAETLRRESFTGSRSPLKAEVIIPPPPPPIMQPGKAPPVPMLQMPPGKKRETKMNVPLTAVRSGLVDVGSLRAQKGLLKSVTSEGPKRSSKRHKKGPKSPLKESATFSMQHSSLLAKAVAARAARMATEEKDKEAGTEHKSDDEFAEPSPGKKEIIPSSRVETDSQVRVVRSSPRASKVPPPVMPKKKVASRGKGGVQSGGPLRVESSEQRNLPFNIPVPVLSEEDRTLVLLDEVLRHEAESENWSLNSWNSSDSSVDVIVPPPFFSVKDFPKEQSEGTGNTESSTPWYERRSESEENLSSGSSTSPNRAPSPFVHGGNAEQSEASTQGPAVIEATAGKEDSQKMGKPIARQIPIKIGNKQISISVITHSQLPEESPELSSPAAQRKLSFDKPVDKNKPEPLSDDTDTVLIATPVPTVETTPVPTTETTPVRTDKPDRPAEDHPDNIVLDRTPFDDSGDDVFELPLPPMAFDDLQDIDGDVPDSPPLPPPPEFCLFSEGGFPGVVGPDELVEEQFVPPPAFGLEQENEVDRSSPIDIPAAPTSPKQTCSVGFYQDKPMLEWSCKDVCNWLDSIGMSQYRETFEVNDIRGIHLPELTKAELRELGVKSLGHRMTIENSIAQLCHPMESSC